MTPLRKSTLKSATKNGAEESDFDAADSVFDAANATDAAADVADGISKQDFEDSLRLFCERRS